jgi:hypothetical protein
MKILQHYNFFFFYCLQAADLQLIMRIDRDIGYLFLVREILLVP